MNIPHIIHEFPVKEIFLFGFYAAGNPREECDIDLCIITGQKARKIDLLKQVRRVIASAVTKPDDLLVYK